MGHYRADLACSDCGEVRCRCPVKPSVLFHGFVIDPSDDAFEVLNAKQFEKKYTAIARPGTSLAVYTLGLQTFRLRSEAEAARPDAIAAKANDCQKQVNVLLARINRLNVKLDESRNLAKAVGKTTNRQKDDGKQSGDLLPVPPRKHAKLHRKP